jgi:general stress protein 26
MMLIYHEGKFYYASDSGDEKVSQVTFNPKIEICVLLGEGDNGGSLRISGIAEFVYNEDTRRNIHGCIGFIQSFWENPQDPGFVLLEIKPNEIRYMRPGTMEIKKQVLL